MSRPGFRAMIVPCLVACLALLGSCGSSGSDSGGDGGNRALPVVTTLGSQVVSTSQATLSGSIHPNGRDTEYWFEWGTDAALASPTKTATKVLPASSSVQAVSETVTGLTAGTKVYFRLCARNPDGTVQGQVKPYHHYANVVFVTSAKGTGNLGSWADAGGKVGREAGDNVCQTLAGRAGLEGTFKGWLSDSAGAARDRLAHSTAPYMRVDGVQIGSSWADFTVSPYLDNPIDRDENGVLVQGAVHTETRVGGNTGIGMGGNACRDWVSSAASDILAGGWTLYKDYRWTESGLRSCNNVFSLYCFQQNFNLPQEHASTGCAGPIGWVWHVSACSKGLFQDPECKYVCCNFYSGTHNCNTIPATFGGYTVTGCSYNTGLYSMSVTHSGTAFTVRCELH